jgi:hypothetical protein
VGKYSFSRPELIPYLISPYLGNDGIVLGSLISYRPSRNGGIISEDEENSLSICNILFKDGLIRLVAILSSKIVSLPPTSMNFLL